MLRLAESVAFSHKSSGPRGNTRRPARNQSKHPGLRLMWSFLGSRLGQGSALTGNQARPETLRKWVWVVSRLPPRWLAPPYHVVGRCPSGSAIFAAKRVLVAHSALSVFHTLCVVMIRRPRSREKWAWICPDSYCASHCRRVN